MITGTYTQTIQIDEPEVTLSDEDVRRMSKMLDDMIMREILGAYACNEFEKSLRSAKATI